MVLTQICHSSTVKLTEILIIIAKKMCNIKMERRTPSDSWNVERRN